MTLQLCNARFEFIDIWKKYKGRVMKNRFIKCILSIIIFTSISCLSDFTYASLLNENTVPPTKLLVNTQNGLSRDERLNVAKKLINNINELKHILPKLSDISRRNLEEQKSSIENTSNFFDKNGKINEEASEEWSANLRSYYDNLDSYLYEMVLRIDTINYYLTCIANENNVKKEMYYWAIVSSIFLSEQWDLSINILIRKNKINDISMTGDDSPLVKISRLGHLYHNFGMGILSNIIIPYLKVE